MIFPSIASGTVTINTGTVKIQLHKKKCFCATSFRSVWHKKIYYYSCSASPERNFLYAARDALLQISFPMTCPPALASAVFIIITVAP